MGLAGSGCIGTARTGPHGLLVLSCVAGTSFADRPNQTTGTFKRGYAGWSVKWRAVCSKGRAVRGSLLLIEPSETFTPRRAASPRSSFTSPSSVKARSLSPSFTSISRRLTLVRAVNSADSIPPSTVPTLFWTDDGDGILPDPVTGGGLELVLGLLEEHEDPVDHGAAVLVPSKACCITFVQG